MIIEKEILNELKKRFPSVCGVLHFATVPDVLVQYKGKEDKETKAAIEKFLKERVSPLVKTHFAFIEKGMSIQYT
jgi:hypothetical protein